MTKITHLANTLDGQRVFITPEDRERNIHILGLHGMGKTKLLEHMIREDIREGNGLCLLDIQGNLYYDLVRWLSEGGWLSDEEIKSKIVLINPSISEWSVAFNPLDTKGIESKDISAFADGLLETILSVNDRNEGAERPPLITRILRAVFYTAIENKLTLVEARHLLASNDLGLIREFCTHSSHSFINDSEWAEFNALRQKDRSEWFMGPINRLIDVIGSESIQRMVSQTTNTLDFLKLMEEGYIVLVNLAYDEMSWSYNNSRMLGRLLLHEITTKARLRIRKDGEHPKEFYLYIDECYEFLNDDLARGLAALRQFGLRFILSHQGMFQLDDMSEGIGGAVRALTGTKICFRVDTTDMEESAKRMFLEEIDLQEEKETLRTKGVAGHKREIFYGGSNNESEAVVTSEGSSTGRGSGISQAVGEGFAIDPTGGLGGTTLDRETISKSASNMDFASVSSAASLVKGQTESLSWSEQLVPILEDQVGGVYTMDEQFFRKGRALALLPKRLFVMYRPSSGAEVCQTVETETACPTDERILEEQHEYYGTRSFAEKSTVVEKIIRQRETVLKEKALESINQRERLGTLEDPSDYFEEFDSEHPQD